MDKVRSRGHGSSAMAGPCGTTCWPRTRRRSWGNWKSQGPSKSPQSGPGPPDGSLSLRGLEARRPPRRRRTHGSTVVSACLWFFFLSPSFSGDLQPLRGGNAEARHSPASETLWPSARPRGGPLRSHPHPAKSPQNARQRGDSD